MRAGDSLFPVDMRRIVIPEILDSLPPEHPDAIASRRDLRLIHKFMGCERWLPRRVRELADGKTLRILEIGAGSGALAKRLARMHEVESVTCIDLAPPPDSLPSKIRWMRGNIFDLEFPKADIVVASLFLHHFSEGEMRVLFEKIGSAAPVLLASEPARFRRHLAAFALLRLAMINRVTWHDGRASIRAGFRKGELPAILGPFWRVCREEYSLFGAIHVHAVRR